jgi:DNA invertase Pin-like site-specific DNA recombinase
MPQFVAYYRVSTDRQGQSGLGLEAQQKAVVDHVGRAGGAIVSTFTEVESGKRKDRPELLRALAACRRIGAVLVIAKLDRLARNVHFVSGLMESGVEFVACDNPHANKLMIHILSAFAEHEREVISERTTAALRAAKARGVRLGVMGAVRAAENKADADAFAAGLAPVLDDIRAEGHTTVAAITRELNRLRVPTPREGRWHRATVRKVLERMPIS